MGAGFDENVLKGEEMAEFFSALGQFIEKAGWPIIALIAVFLFRKPLQNIRSMKLSKDGAEFSVGEEIKRQVEAAGTATSTQGDQGRSQAPSADELARAGKIEALAKMQAHRCCGARPLISRRSMSGLEQQWLQATGVGAVWKL